MPRGAHGFNHGRASGNYIATRKNTYTSGLHAFSIHLNCAAGCKHDPARGGKQSVGGIADGNDGALDGMREDIAFDRLRTTAAAFIRLAQAHALQFNRLQPAAFIALKSQRRSAGHVPRRVSSAGGVPGAGRVGQKLGI